MVLVNKVDKRILKEQLQKETFQRRTISFYRYFHIEDVQQFRDQLFQSWSELNCFGRIYVANEGINAQMSIPEHNLSEFLERLYAIQSLNETPIKYAVEDDGKSFYKLTIKIRPKIVADGLEDGAFDRTNVGTHLSALEFHKALDEENVIVVDMRNHYESEIGYFENAYCPDVDTFRDCIQHVVQHYAEEKDKKYLLYCTGGVRCEKASAYMKHHGFSQVFQLYGGIIDYAQQVKKAGVSSKFVGKNFVFDERMGESVDGRIVSQCHQCGKPADTHTNCKNDDCHLLFIQCAECASLYQGCCSNECTEVNQLSATERAELRGVYALKYADSKIFKSRLRPHLQSKHI